MGCDKRSIGIITFHKYYNYGTALQAYALQNYISKHYSDCDVELIDYTVKNEFVGKKLILTRIKRLSEYLKNFKKYYVLYRNRPYQIIKKQAFDVFFKESMVVSENGADTVEALPAICDKYDAVMVGSDQTWNPFVSTKGVFLLEWLDGKKKKKLAYAPSIGISNLPDGYRERYKTALSDFKFLSCRERGGAEFLSELLGKNVEFVLDPTLLLKPEDWEEIATPIDIKEPYLLTYFLGDNKSHRKAAERIAKEKNLKIVALPVSHLEINNKNIKKMYGGPGEFVSLIKNAAFVCTDSFHGTMFSINFHKDFMAFPKRKDVEVNSDNNRLYDALKVFGLENRLGIEGVVNTDSVCYEDIDSKLTELREQSTGFLTKVIGIV